MAVRIAGPMAVGKAVNEAAIRRTPGQPVGGNRVGRNQSCLRTKLGRHVAQCHTRPHWHGSDRRAGKFQRLIPGHIHAMRPA